MYFIIASLMLGGGFFFKWVRGKGLQNDGWRLSFKLGLYNISDDGELWRSTFGTKTPCYEDHNDDVDIIGTLIYNMMIGH